MALIGNPAADMARIKPPDFQTMLEFCEQTKGVLFSEVAMNIASMIERDLCFIEQLKQAPGKKIAGIFGLGHLYGIEKLWNEPFKTEMLYSHNRGFQQIIELWGKVYVPEIERRIKELEEKENSQ